MSAHTEQCTMGDRYAKYVGLYRLQLRPAYLFYKTQYGYPFVLYGYVGVLLLINPFLINLFMSN